MTDDRAPGILKAWRGTKHEELQVFIILILWDNYVSSLNYYTSPEFGVALEAWVPFLAGRELFTGRHMLVHDVNQLEQAIATKSIEVAMTRVKPGKVANYYEAFLRVVHGVLTHDPGCDGYYINSTLEDPNWQVGILEIMLMCRCCSSIGNRWMRITRTLYIIRVSMIVLLRCGIIIIAYRHLGTSKIWNSFTKSSQSISESYISFIKLYTLQIIL